MQSLSYVFHFFDKDRHIYDPVLRKKKRYVKTYYYFMTSESLTAKHWHVSLSKGKQAALHPEAPKRGELEIIQVSVVNLVTGPRNIYLTPHSKLQTPDLL